MIPCRDQQIQRPVNIDRARADRILEGAWDRGERGLVEHESDAMQGFLAGLQGPDVPLHELDRPSDRLEIVEPARCQVVQHADPLSAGHQRVDEI